MPETRKGRIDLATGARGEDFDLPPNGDGRCPHVCDRGLRNNGIVRIDEHGKACGSRQQLVQEAKLLGRKFKVHRGDAGDVTPWLVDGSDESSPDRVSADLEDDRNCRRRGLGHKCCWCVGRRGDDGNSALNQFGCQLRQPIELILGPVYSIVTFRPSTNPTSLKPCRNASTNSAESSRAVLLRNPTTGIE